ncbi:helix-turn-helix domain-containing protein [Bradyrhizobium sp. Pear76]|uniref:helix-turn-helix domain-containing protein n=1 Tax=Bradyrhizobium oropedii TaxID=1571201 RepID=UPI001E57BC0B|nr:helix-turn-helix domain-containing protein [Bradyrhizobium oropedii]MCC8963755.1 helix-turn-helix domain-containing protein [Bradyrhizobium oropedii]
MNPEAKKQLFVQKTYVAKYFGVSYYTITAWQADESLGFPKSTLVRSSKREHWRLTDIEKWTPPAPKRASRLSADHTDIDPERLARRMYRQGLSGDAVAAVAFALLHIKELLHGEKRPVAKQPVPADPAGPPTTVKPRLAYTVPEFCQILGISRALFYKMVKQGKGPRLMKIGSLTRISAEALQDFKKRMV